MIFTFCYFKFPDSESLHATILPNRIEDDMENLIASYLVDSGGASLKSHIEYLKECLRALGSPSTYEADISSNSYSAKIRNDGVRVSFLYDEIQSIKVSRTKLQDITKAWILFLEREPIAGYIETMYIA
ncbi:DUF5376 family protein [Psychrobacter sp.]|uniref:DUF5376 family protein n=1 Tax=Psychrobacter sp. TaxID=56811 RepID=UPI0006D89F4B